MTEAPWLDLALSELGTREIAGPQDNPKIVKYFDDVGRPDIKNDETAWCAAAQGSWLVRSGYPLPNVNSGLMLLARSYTDYGKPCEPKVGAIGVWPRGTQGWQGHVGTVVRVNAATVHIIAGNQNNSVSIAIYPIKTALAFRWPVKPEIQDLRKHGQKDIKDSDLVETVGWLGVFWAAMSAILTGVTQLYSTLLSQPWIVFIVVLCLLLIVVAKRWKEQLQKAAKAGMPLFDG